MQLFAFGINHNTAPLNIREQIAFPQDVMEHALHDLVEHQAVKEAAIVSTCNRTEIYCSTDKPDAAIHWLSDFHHLPARELGAKCLPSKTQTLKGLPKKLHGR